VADHFNLSWKNTWQYCRNAGFARGIAALTVLRAKREFAGVIQDSISVPFAFIGEKSLLSTVSMESAIFFLAVAIYPVSIARTGR